MKLSELAKPVTIFPQCLKNLKVSDKKAAQADPRVMEAVKRVADRLGDNGRVLVRESGTEPLIRVMAEASTNEICTCCVDEILDVIKACGYEQA